MNRNDLVICHLHLAYKTATIWQGRCSLERDELFAIACLALVRASRKWEPNRNSAFPTYAITSMVNAIRDALDKENKQRLIQSEYRSRCVVEPDDTPEKRDEIINHLKRFGTQERKVFLLRFKHELTFRQIANKLRCTQLTVNRALKKFKRVLV